MLSNARNTVLYVGVTSMLYNRIWQHKNKFYPKSFTARYNIDKLLYFECFNSIEEAIVREKKLKNYSRKNKEKLINKFNVSWKDLHNSVIDY